jgi:hypothetical protein
VIRRRGRHKLQATPAWAAGARVFETVGPLLRLKVATSGLIFRIERLVALYIQGRAEPVMFSKLLL